MTRLRSSMMGRRSELAGVFHAGAQPRQLLDGGAV